MLEAGQVDSCHAATLARDGLHSEACASSAQSGLIGQQGIQRVEPALASGLMKLWGGAIPMAISNPHRSDVRQESWGIDGGMGRPEGIFAQLFEDLLSISCDLIVFHQSFPFVHLKHSFEDSIHVLLLGFK